MANLLFESSLSLRIFSSLKGRTFDRPDIEMVLVSTVYHVKLVVMHKGNLNWPVRVSTTLVQKHVPHLEFAG